MDAKSRTIATARLSKYPDLEINGQVNFIYETDWYNVEIYWEGKARLRVYWQIPYLDAAMHQMVVGMMEVYNNPQPD